MKLISLTAYEVKKRSSKSSVLAHLNESLSGSKPDGVKEIQEHSVLDSVGQASDAIDEAMLVNGINNQSVLSVSDSELRTVLIENWLAYAPEDFIVQEQSVIVPERDDEFGTESEAQG